MSELEELPSWAGRSMSGPKPAQPDSDVPAANQTAAAGGKPVVDAGHAAGQAADRGRTNLDQQAGIIQREAAPTTQHTPPARRRRPWLMLLFGLLGLLALVGMGALGYFLAESQNSNETATSSAVDTAETDLGSEAEDTGIATNAETAADAEGAEDAAEQAPVTVDTDPADDAATGDDAAESEEPDAAAETEGAATDEATDATTDPAAASDSGRQAIFKGGKVYLSGSVPSEEVSKFIQDKAAAVVGPDNVVNEYVIDPTSEIEPGSSAPLYVEDVVLFPFNSVEIANPFLPILDLGTLLLRQNPQASITVVTRTDAVGSEEVNLDVSTKRAQAVINYWLSKGVNRDQINADPRGEEGASEADDEEAAALRRRAEFIITGLLD